MDFWDEEQRLSVVPSFQPPHNSNTTSKKRTPKWSFTPDHPPTSITCTDSCQPSAAIEKWLKLTPSVRPLSILFLFSGGNCEKQLKLNTELKN